ncbi:MAG: ImmA/IrrE family metallo-endopeptidase [Ectobacillus sp.]
MSDVLTSRLRSISHRCEARELANKVLEMYFEDQEPSFPINIFKMLNEFGISYKFLELKQLDGMYIPDKDGKVAVVGINSNGTYERQRFTAAHELCHHLRDYDVPSVTKPNDNTTREIFANKFASELLMPSKYFNEYARRYQDEHGFVQPDSALYLCNIFGTSFEGVMWLLKQKNLLSFDLKKEFFLHYKVSEKIKNLDIQKLDYTYLQNIVDNYTFIPQGDTSPLWLRLKNELIYHDSKIEGLDIDKETVAEICTDLRLFGTESRYFKAYGENKAIIETVGQYYLYDELQSKEGVPDRYELSDFNKTLFKLAPTADEMGRFRESDNSITGAIILTTPYYRIPEAMYTLDQDIKYYCSIIEQSSFSKVIEIATLVHHRLTQIHPFEDGNGRVSRALLNWMLKLKNLPPVYVEARMKQQYLTALTEADKGDYSLLNKFFLERVLSSLIFLNSELSCENASLIPMFYDEVIHDDDISSEAE